MPVEISLLKQIIADQREEHKLPVDYFIRTQEGKLRELAKTKEIVVLTGIRRCGKSVLMQRLRQNADQSDYYFNFEDERLVNFSVGDFQTLQMVFIEMFGVQSNFYFDEIQNIPGWEMFARRLYNADNKIFVTGANANLFSEELGTRLTGRYISLEVYPLSFKEYARAELPDKLEEKNVSTAMLGKIRGLFQKYLHSGGIPEHIKHGQTDYLRALYESILYRDIIVRYNIQTDAVIKKLVFFLASNCSKETTYNALRKALDIGSATTISNYCSYLESSYLCFFVSRYSDSVKSQLTSPKKVYFIDHAIVRTLGFRFSEDFGRMLENIVFIELKRRQFEVYYHREQKECDFIVRQGPNTVSAIQVCQHLSDSATKKRKVDGLLEALQRFSLQEGYILTESTEAIEQHKQAGEEYTVRIIPIWKWLLELGV
jgi:uncharacterized protein